MGVVMHDWRTDLTAVLPHFFGAASATVPDRAIARRTCAIECGPGWAAIVDSCCVRIAATLEERERFRFASIQSRDGVLRIRWGGRLTPAGEAAVRSAIDLAEARSMYVCELCGNRGRRFRADGAVATRCPDHAAGAPAFSDAMDDVHLIQVTVKGRLRVVVGARYDFAGDRFVEIDDVSSLRREA